MAQVKSVSEVYKSVVIDVIDGVRESFIDEGVDEHVLSELKQMWENKLRMSKAFDLSGSSSPRLIPPPAHSHHPTKIYNQNPQLQQQLQQQQPLQQQQQLQQQHFQQFQQQQLLINAVSLANDKANSNNIQITTANNTTTTLQQLNSYQGSVINLGSSQLGQLEGQTISPMLLQQFNNVNCLVQQNGNNRPILIQSALPTGGNFVQPQQGIVFGLSNQPVATSATPQNGVTLDNNNVTNIVQLDGLGNSSSEEEDDDDDGGKRPSKRGKFEEDDEDEEPPSQQAEVEDEPLNSDDDEKSDVESHDHFETDNVVVCQFDKVNRSKARWKFHLKDGIMNISGKDYVFQKATGDAEF